jgi:predicted nucleotidyltransferase
MNRDDIQRRLKDHREELTASGVKSLAVFGSVARGKAKAGSDLDLLVDFDAPATFDQYMTLKFFLEDLFQCRIDLVTRKALKPRMRAHVEKEAILVA